MTAPAPKPSPMGLAALGLARAGLRVFPLHSAVDGQCSCRKKDCDRPGKHPRTAKGLHDASADEAQALRWWRSWPDAPIGVRTGDGLVVVDVDGEQGKQTMGELVARHSPLPESARSWTGGGGAHLWFRTSVPVPCSVELLGVKVDVRGEGGYVVAPPSLHASGRHYAWDEGAGLEMLSDAPEWIVSLASRKREARPPAGGPDAQRQYIKGGRNKALTSLAGTMRKRGMAVVAILAALLAENVASCRPPLDEAEVKRIANSVGRYAPDPDAAPQGEQAGDTDGDQSAAGENGGGGVGAVRARRVLALLRSLEWFQTPTGRVFCLVGGEVLAADSEAFLCWASAQYLERHGSVVGKAVINDVVTALKGGRLPRRAIALRAGGDAGRFALDLGDELHRSVEVSVDGVRVFDDPLALFYRPPGTLPLPVPLVPCSDADSATIFLELRQLLDVAEDHAWTCCLAWLLASLRPVGPYPLLVLRGEKGSGKSTLARQLRSLIDPRQPELKTLPKDTRDLAIGAEHAHVLAFDNLSTLDGDLSDALCRLAYGDGFETRALYTGRSLDVFQAARPVVLTSITDVATRSDLLDRALMVRIPARERRADDDALDAQLLELRPRALGALLHAAHRALLLSPSTVVPDSIRMRAPARFAAGAEAALGLAPGAIAQAYLASRDEGTDVDALDPVAEALLSWLEPGPAGCDWEGPLSELLSNLSARWAGKKQPRSWPETPRALRAILDRLAPTLRRFRVSVEYCIKGHENRRTVAIHRDP
jgi:energy-coupling factor transporter ATP-binding protein EcfA2